MYRVLVKSIEILGLEPFSKISLMADAAGEIGNGFSESKIPNNIRGVEILRLSKLQAKEIKKKAQKLSVK